MIKKKLCKFFLVIVFLTVIFLLFKIYSRNQRQLFIFKVNDREWTMNGNVAQFSSVLEITNRTKITIESLCFINNFKQKENIKLVLFDRSNFFFYKADEILAVPVMKTISNVTHFYKIKVFIEIETVNVEFLYVATVFIENKSITNNPRLLTFQKPTVYNNTSPKNNIINCVHRFKNLNDELLKKILNWLMVMKNIGYSKIIFYTFYTPITYRLKILEQFNNFVEIIDYNIKFKDLCKLPLLKSKFDQNNDYFLKEISYCYINFKIFFEKYNTKGVKIDQAVNRLGSNDCLLHSKFDFKFMTNLDFDEVIFPRRYKTNIYEDFISNHRDLCAYFEIWRLKNMQKYDILSFIEDLKKNYSSDIAYIEFENYQLLSQSKMLENEIYKNTNGVISYKSREANLKFIFKDNQKLIKFKEILSIKKCLNDTLKKIHPDFTKIIGSIINNRQGKSIFFTKNTLAIHPHSASIIREKSKSVKISKDIANVIHFRQSDTKIDKTLTEDFLNIDIEYFMFLKNLKF